MYLSTCRGMSYTANYLFTPAIVFASVHVSGHSFPALFTVIPTGLLVSPMNSSWARLASYYQQLLQVSPCNVHVSSHSFINKSLQYYIYLLHYCSKASMELLRLTSVHLNKTIPIPPIPILIWGQSSVPHHCWQCCILNEGRTKLH